MNRDDLYMTRCVQLARLGEYYVAPNPMVGALLVSDAEDRILGEGWHERYGEAHAEPNCLRKAEEKNIEGIDYKHSTLYVSLEPCTHIVSNLLLYSPFSHSTFNYLDPFNMIYNEIKSYDMQFDRVLLLHQEPPPRQVPPVLVLLRDVHQTGNIPIAALHVQQRQILPEHALPEQQQNIHTVKPPVQHQQRSDRRVLRAAQLRHPEHHQGHQREGVPVHSEAHHPLPELPQMDSEDVRSTVLRHIPLLRVRVHVYHELLPLRHTGRLLHEHVGQRLRQCGRRRGNILHVLLRVRVLLQRRQLRHLSARTRILGRHIKTALFVSGHDLLLRVLPN